MKIRSVVLMMAVCLAAVTMSYAENVHMGTWKLNEGKSKLVAGTIKNTSVVYSMDGDNVKCVTDGTGVDGKPMHTEWTGKFDGKDYPLTGDPNSDVRAYTKVNDHTLTLANKKGGKDTTTGKIEVSADGKRRTLTTSGKDSMGMKVTSVSVYDKQ
jgi:hypothetical protein